MLFYMETIEWSDWKDLLACNKRHIECSLEAKHGKKHELPFTYLRDDCDNPEDVAALLKLQSYGLLVEGDPESSWRGFKPEKLGPYEGDDVIWKYEESVFERRGIPCLSFAVAKDSIPSTFIDRLLSNPKLHAVVWNGLEGTLYKDRTFDPDHTTSYMDRILGSKSADDWFPRGCPSRESNINLEDISLGHLKYEVYICSVLMAMDWKDYSGMSDEEFYDAIDQFNIIDEIESVLQNSGAEPKFA